MRRVVVVHENRPPSTVTTQLVGALRAGGVDVALLRAGERPFSVSEADVQDTLYVLRHADESALTIGALLHDAGARTLNPYPAVATCRDKAATAARLAAAGLPVPEGWFVAEPGGIGDLLDGGAVIVKPNRGSKGTGVTVVGNAAELGAVAGNDGPFLVQRYHRPEGLDRKLYRIGDDVFCVGRRFPVATAADKQGALLNVDDKLRRIAIGVGEAIGIDIFGADVVYSGGRPWLVDVSSFPGFKGVPDAGRLLADRIAAAINHDVEVCS
ncbi:MAG TPA: hypothetical protein VM324_00040 [Egibacteraceae bacterium]|nr:hypothetical protein [Egibacteraceae bacterium]